MTAELASGWRHAAKRHYCQVCDDAIEIGDLHHASTFAEDYIWTWRLCVRCVDLEAAFVRDHLTDWRALDEGWDAEGVLEWAADVSVEPDHPAYRLASRLTTRQNFDGDARRADRVAGVAE